jgi:hypothetical protein
MRTALVLLALAACPVPRAADGGPPASASAHEGVAAGSGNAEASTEGSGSTEEHLPATATFTIEGPRTDAWVVAGGACMRLSFRPSDASSGAVLVRGVRIDYARRADELELGPASRSDGDGLVSRPCRTRLRIGPGRTLGGATLFDDEAACTAGRATAAPLDDSAEATAARCRGEPVAVTTDEVECGVGGRHAVVAGRPGCIGVVLMGL